MSSTYSLVCHETNQKLWVGQGSSRMYIYGTSSFLDKLARFLDAHRGKNLKFVLDDGEAEQDCREFEGSHLVAGLDEALCDHIVGSIDYQGRSEIRSSMLKDMILDKDFEFKFDEHGHAHIDDLVKFDSDVKKYRFCPLCGDDLDWYKKL